MGLKELMIKISVDSNNAQKGLNQVKKGLDEISKQSDKISFDKLRRGFNTSVSGAITLVGNLTKAFGSLALASGNLIRLNSSFELMKNQLITLIATADKSNISDALKLEKATKEADGLIDKFKTLDEKLAYTANDLTDMFKSFYSTAGGSMSLGDAVKAFENIAYAAGASGAEVNSLKMTLDSLGNGVVNTATDFGRFLSGMGASTKEFKKAIEDGNFAEVLNSYLAKYKEMAELMPPTFDAIKNSTINAFNEIQRKAGEPLFDELKKSLTEINKYLDDGASELQESLNDLGEAGAEFVRNFITPDSIKSVADGLRVLIDTTLDLSSVMSDLNDLVVPDWLVGEKDAGIGTALKKSANGWNMLFNNFKANMQNLKLSDGFFDSDGNRRFLESLVNDSNKAFDEIKSSLKGLGGEFSGANEIAFDPTKINADLVVDEISKIDEKIKELKEKNKEIDSGSWFDDDGAYESKRAIDTLIKALETYKEQLKSVGEAKKEVSQTDLNKQAESENKKALDNYIRSYEARVKAHGKTIESLKKQEASLTKSLIEGEKERQNIINSYSQKRLDIAFSADEKIRRANQTGMSDQQKFYDDQLAMAKNLSKAKEALLQGDVETYKRFSELANSLNESLGTEATFKNGDNEQKINRVNEYKNAVLELADLESKSLSQQEAKELEAHDKKMASIQAELEATRAKIDLEMTFYTELMALQEKLGNNEIQFDAVGFEETKAKMAELDALLSSEKSLNLNSSGANSQIESVKQNLLTLNGVTLEVDANTTPADFGIDKFINEIDAKGDVNIKINPEFKEAQAKIDEVKDEAKKPAELRIKANDTEAKGKIKELTKTTTSKHDINVDDTKARSAIKRLQKNTSSTHTVYVKEIKRKALGGLIDGFKNGGLLGFRRKKGKIPGHDLSGSDDVPAMLTRGEFVQNVRAVDYYGSDFFYALNQRKIPKQILGLASGGLVINGKSSDFMSSFDGRSGGGGRSYDGKIKNLMELIAFLEKALKNPYLYEKTRAYFSETLSKAKEISKPLNADENSANGFNTIQNRNANEAKLITEFNSYLDETQKEKEYAPQNIKKEREWDESVDLEAIKAFIKAIEGATKNLKHTTMLRSESINSANAIQNNPLLKRLLPDGRLPSGFYKKKEQKEIIYSFLDFLMKKGLFVGDNPTTNLFLLNGIMGGGGFAYSRNSINHAFSKNSSVHDYIRSRIKRFKTGGIINLSRGGKLKGYGGGDKNLALLEDGEFVLRKEAVRKWGATRLKKLNALSLPKFQSGGYVGNISNISNITNGSVDKNVNINFDFGKNQKASVLSDEATAVVIERYLKGAL